MPGAMVAGLVLPHDGDKFGNKTQGMRLAYTKWKDFHSLVPRPPSHEESSLVSQVQFLRLVHTLLTV